MNKNQVKNQRRARIKRRIRATIKGTADRPRLTVYKSSKHLYAQLVNDRLGHTLASSSTVSNDISGELSDKTRTEAAKVVGDDLARKAKEQGIDQVVFDRSGYRYHGVVKALAEGAREGGLDF